MAAWKAIKSISAVLFLLWSVGCEWCNDDFRQGWLRKRGFFYGTGLELRLQGNWKPEDWPVKEKLFLENYLDSTFTCNVAGIVNWH